MGDEFSDKRLKLGLGGGTVSTWHEKQRVHDLISPKKKREGGRKEISERPSRSGVLM